MLIARAQGTTTAPPAALFARWADMATWPEWNTDTEWVRLDGPFVEGATGRLKPKGGPVVRFTVTKLVPDAEFVDVSTLFGARLEFDHQVRRTGETTTLVVTISLTGPLRWFWAKIMGAGLAASAQPDIDNLLRTLVPA
jgi:hypothetical protein